MGFHIWYSYNDTINKKVQKYIKQWKSISVIASSNYE